MKIQRKVDVKYLTKIFLLNFKLKYKKNEKVFNFNDLNVDAQIFRNCVSANFHHLIFDFVKIGDCQRASDVPLSEILVDWSNKFHAEIAVGKLENFIEAIQ